MAEILEQEEELLLDEGEELGSLEDLAVAPSDSQESDEVEEKVAETEPEEIKIPEKFRGKGVEDIVKSYEELEKAFGQKNNEVGELRKLTDEFLKQSLQLNEGRAATAESSNNIEVDDLLDDPNTAINKVLNSNPTLQKLEAQLIEAQRAEARKSFEAKYPGGIEKIVSPEVQNFINASPVRQRLFMEAHTNYDYDLAGELLSAYEAQEGVRVQDAQGKQKANRDKALREGSVERGSSGQSPKKVYRRTDLMKMMMTNRDAYDDPAFQAELVRAYQEGRVR